MTTATRTNRKLEAALDCARVYGFRIVRCHYVTAAGECSCTRGAACDRPGKHPSTENGSHDGTTDLDVIGKWWRQRPDANLAVATGVDSGVVVLDEDEIGAIERLEALHGPFPPTVTAISGRGGRHLYFLPPADPLLKNKQGGMGGMPEGVDFRAEGGYLMLPGSNHASGNDYRWAPGRSPEDVRPAPLPEWLVGICAKEDIEGDSEPPPRRTDAPQSDLDLLLKQASAYVSNAGAPDQGRRNTTAFNIAGHLAAFVVEDSGLTLSEGQALDLMRTWNSRCNPAMSIDELADTVHSAFIGNGTARTPKIVKRTFERNGHAGNGAAGNGAAGNGAAGNGSRYWDDAPPPGDADAPYQGNGAHQAKPSTGKPLPEIEATADEHLVNDAALVALGSDETVYQRGGILVHVVEVADDSKATGDIARPTGAPRIVSLPNARLREVLSKVAIFYRMTKVENEWKQSRQHVPDHAVKAIMARGNYPNIRQLKGVVASPVLRPDGSILTKPGYDPQTGLLYVPDGVTVNVPESPTRRDAIEAVAALVDVVADFPFSKPEHRSACLAGILTPIARSAFEGPSPLVLADSNVPGAGKTKSFDVTSIIATGREMPRMSAPQNDAEFRKSITSAAIGGDRMVLIDNVTSLGCPSFDAALTSAVWRDRLLGFNEVVELPLRVSWFASGNNVALKADTARRTLHVRLDSPHERPEERRDFAHPDLLAWVKHERPRLLSACLTILRAFYGAGCPDQGLLPWGSFEHWSAVVRGALVWCGCPDPADTRTELRERADTDVNALRALLEGWPSIDPEGRGLTAAEIVQGLAVDSSQRDEVRAAIAELCPPPPGKPVSSSRSIGNRFRRLRGRVVGGRALDSRDSHGTAVWYVKETEPPQR